MQMNGAEIIVNTLVEQGCDTVFGYPGGQVVDLYDALYKAQDQVHHVLTAHEQGAVHAADGYARATGRVGVVIATSGPGATNLVTGIATAMLDSIPLVAITGNVPTSLIGKDSFQEVNILGVTMPITKHNYFVTDVNELADTLREAFQIAKSGRPGPVLVDVPKDVQLALCDFTPQGPVGPESPPPADEAAIDEAVELIRTAERPIVYIGGGAARSCVSEEIVALAERLDAYISCTFMGLSVVPTAHPRFLGMQGMHGHFASTFANDAADLIIGIGVRFSDRATGKTSGYARRARIIQLDADLTEINKSIHVDVGLIGDLRATLQTLLQKLEPQRHPNWEREVAALCAEGVRKRIAAENETPGALRPDHLFDILNAKKSDADLIVTDVGQHQMWAAQYANLSRPRSFISSGGLGTMGFGMGASIGAHIGTGKRPILITGDGSFAMNLNELVTAVTYHIPLTIVLLNNDALGMVHQWQELFFDRRFSATEHGRFMDYPKLAEAFGAKGVTVDTAEAFAAALDDALCQTEPVLIEARIHTDALVMPMLPPGGAIQDIIFSKQEVQT